MVGAVIAVDPSSPSVNPWNRRVAFGVVIGFYLVVATCLAVLSRDQLNPDGVAYIQVARNYAAGRFDLAVNSYWGPLLSWVLVPLVWLRADLQLAVKLMGVVLGLGFALGSVGLFRQAGGRRYDAVVLVSALLLALHMVPDPVSPDLLLAALLTAYFVSTAKLMHTPSVGRAFGTGALGGVAYLAKAYALPFVAVHLLVTFVISRVTGGKGTGKPLAASVAGLLLVAAPWIVTISLHDGRPTIGSASRYARAWSPVGGDRAAAQASTAHYFGDWSPLRLAADQPHAVYGLQLPRSGRITSWANPAEIAYSWHLWSPLDGLHGLKCQVQVTVHSMWNTLTFLKKQDLFGLLIAGGLMAGAFLLVAPSSLPRPTAVFFFWALVTAAIYVSGYALVNVVARLLWPVFGLLLAVSIRALLLPATAPARADGMRWPVGRTLLVVLVFLSFGFRAAVNMNYWRPGGTKGGPARWLRESARQMTMDRPVASNLWCQGLYVAYWSNTTYLGELAGEYPEAIANEVAPYGPARVLIFDNAYLAGQLDRSPRFRRVEAITDGPEDHSMWAFDLADRLATPTPRGRPSPADLHACLVP